MENELIDNDYLDELVIEDVRDTGASCDIYQHDCDCYCLSQGCICDCHDCAFWQTGP